MKYTIPQILKFTAMTYQNDSAKAGGRYGYLPGSNKQREALKETKPWLRLALGIGILTSAAFLNFGVSTPEGFLYQGGILSLSLLMVIIGVAYGTHGFIAYNETMKMHEKKAVLFEPSGTWNLTFPEDNRQRASMIRSILGARRMCRRMIAETSIPMSNEAMDAQLSHLIESITHSKEEDIHPYLIDETRSFCKQTIKDFNFYAPLINMQEELKSEFPLKG